MVKRRASLIAITVSPLEAASRSDSCASSCAGLALRHGVLDAAQELLAGSLSPL